jgi:hypothetical protein
MTTARIGFSRILVLVAALAATLAAASCSSPSPQQGTNTNWIACKADADCAKLGAAAVCNAGVCKAPADAAVYGPCKWPSSLDAVDASSRACRAARTIVSCGVPNGGGVICLSNDPTQCPPDPNNVPGPCRAECKADEYAAACGGVGPGPVPDPPAGCRPLFAGPGGGESFCCPCG